MQLAMESVTSSQLIEPAHMYVAACSRVGSRWAWRCGACRGFDLAMDLIWQWMRCFQREQTDRKQTSRQATIRAPLKHMIDTSERRGERQDINTTGGPGEERRGEEGEAEEKERQLRFQGCSLILINRVVATPIDRDRCDAHQSVRSSTRDRPS